MEETRRVYYMTGTMTGIACIALQRLKVSRFNELNDPFELLSVNVHERAARKAFNKVREEFNKVKGLICFAPDWKSPLMWGHYAEKHTGFALGFNIPSKLLKDVKYEHKLFELELDPNTKVDFTRFNRHLLRSKLNWRVSHEESQIPGGIQS